MKLRIETEITDEQIEGLLRLFKVRCEDGDVKMTKKDFTQFIKEQVTRFGNEEFLVGETINEYEELTDAEVSKLRAWGLIA